MNRLVKAIAVLVLIVSVGAHWAILQGVAWTTMVARFAQSMPLTQAVAFTLDGRHPCELCLAVEQGRQAEHKESKLTPPEKLLLFLDLEPLPVLLAPPHAEPTSTSPPSLIRSERPPHPPPRAA